MKLGVCVGGYNKQFAALFVDLVVDAPIIIAPFCLPYIYYLSFKIDKALNFPPLKKKLPGINKIIVKLSCLSHESQVKQ